MCGRRGFIAQLLFLTALFTACSPETRDGRPETVDTGMPASVPEPALSYIITSLSAGPFYFELGSGPPRLIPSPAEASLSPFTPWVHSRHIFRFLPIAGGRGEVLYAAVNRGGILELTNSGGETAVYYTPGGESWEQYPLAAFFRYKEKPAALLTRDRFFSTEEQAPPPVAVWGISGARISERPSIKEIHIPALDPAKDRFLETAGLFLGWDGSWYIHQINAGNRNAYFQSEDISRPGEVISAEQYLLAAAPLESGNPSVPPLLAHVINEAAVFAGTPCVVSLVSPAFPAERLFSGGANAADKLADTGAVGEARAAEARSFGHANTARGSAAPANSFALANNENAVELSGYYCPRGSGREETALVLFPDGRGVYGFFRDGEVKSGRFALPALPPGQFVYTGIALLEPEPPDAALTQGTASKQSSGLVLTAAWEEQENWNVGAAGFVLVEFSP